MTLSFVGHSLVSSSERVKEKVKEQMLNNIAGQDCVTCYLGGYGAFDGICACVCRELKREVPHIELVYVTPYMSLSEQARVKEMLDLRLYDASIYPPIENVPPKFAILKRNEWMMANSDLIIAYVKHSFGGAYKTLQTAKHRKKKIINIIDFL